MEADATVGGVVPPELAEKIDLHRLAMLGTSTAHPRCVALQGVVGRATHCGIYAQRPSVCREVAPSWDFGAVSPQCDKARLAHGLPVFSLDDWVEPNDVVIEPLT